MPFLGHVRIETDNAHCQLRGATCCSNRAHAHSLQDGHLVEYTIFVQHLLTERNPVGDGDFAGVERTEGWLWKYFAVVIALGVVQYPEEKNAFRDGDSSEHPCEGLLGNSYIQRMMSFRQWQICKQHFSGLRDVMTDLVNAAARRLVVPTQCVTPMF